MDRAVHYEEFAAVLLYPVLHDFVCASVPIRCLCIYETLLSLSENREVDSKFKHVVQFKHHKDISDGLCFCFAVCFLNIKNIQPQIATCWRGAMRRIPLRKRAAANTDAETTADDLDLPKSILFNRSEIKV